jgi:general secretion pathway protein G
MKTRMMRRESGAFTLVEIMVVVVILGILAATIIPQFLSQKDDARIAAAKADVSVLGAALEHFNVHMDRYPTTEEGLKVLVEAPSGDEGKWRGPYIQQLRLDPWKKAYQYRNPGTHHPTSFDLWSCGADGKDGGEGVNADIGNWQ